MTDIIPLDEKDLTIKQSRNSKKIDKIAIQSVAIISVIESSLTKHFGTSFIKEENNEVLK